MAGWWSRLLIVAAALAASTAAQAEDPAMRRAAEVAGESMFASAGAVGLVLAVVRGDDSVTLGFGETAKGNKRRPDGKTMVRIGSISKAMTGQILAALALAKTVTLNDPLQSYLPPGIVPELRSRPIRLLDLATHTAGLPRDIDINLDGVPGNPYDRLTPEAYHNWLKGYALSYAPGTAASYSNVGFGLLGDGIGPGLRPDLRRVACHTDHVAREDDRHRGRAAYGPERPLHDRL